MKLGRPSGLPNPRTPCARTIVWPMNYLSEIEGQPQQFPIALLLVTRDPSRDPRVENVERKTAAGEHLVVETADIELRSEFLRRSRAKIADLELSQLVTARLRRPGDVAIGLRLDRRLVDRVRLAHVVDNLIAAPTHVVDAGVDDETHRAEKLGTQTAVIGAGILIEPD